MRFLYFLLLSSFSCYSQVPEYYNSIDFTQTGDDLKNQLTTLITDTHTTLLPYTSDSIDTWDVLKEADLDLNNTDNVLLIYGYNDTDEITKNDKIRDKTLSCHTSSCIGLWNREHVFPKSRATPNLSTSYPSAGTDAHNLRTCDSQMNTSRNNRLFETGTGDSHITNTGNWYVGDEWKGDVARIIMYMYVRYPSQCQAINIGTGSTSYSNFNDMYNLFLDWNVEDPVSDYERQRNNILESVQGNRNPFIDNPYLATIIWNGDSASDTWNIALGLNELKVNDIKIYPTLTNDYIYLKNYTASCNVVIYTINAQQIILPVINNSINVSSLSKGIYFLKVQDNHNLYNFKFIKL